MLYGLLMPDKTLKRLYCKQVERGLVPIKGGVPRSAVSKLSSLSFCVNLSLGRYQSRV